MLRHEEMSLSMLSDEQATRQIRIGSSWITVDTDPKLLSTPFRPSTWTESRVMQLR